MNQRTLEYWLTRPEIYKMTYREFLTEYQECMDIARIKEQDFKKALSEEELKMHESDWREYCKYRGYTDLEIAEFARWHKVSGQSDKLENATNSPWRKNYPIWDSRLYIKHIERALDLSIPLSNIILENYKMVKAEIDRFDNINNNQKQPNQTTEYEVAPPEWDDLIIPDQSMIA